MNTLPISVIRECRTSVDIDTRVRYGYVIYEKYLSLSSKKNSKIKENLESYLPLFCCTLLKP